MRVGTHTAQHPALPFISLCPLPHHNSLEPFHFHFAARFAIVFIACVVVVWKQ